LIATKFKSTTSRLVALTIVKDTDDIMMVTANGVVTRLNAGSISCQGRPATGVRAQNLVDNDTVASVNKIVNTDEDEDSLAPEDSSTNEEISVGEQTSLIDNTDIEE
jgi:DNA gyrase subunit A